jgi:hypothetical protein
MRRIDIFISSLEDVQIERSVAERLIRSEAAEFSVPVSVSYSNGVRRLNLGDDTIAHRENADRDSPLLLCPCFWEHQDSKAEQEYEEHIPNTSQYDLVICILWSRPGNKLAPTLFMPDGSQPRSATDYEVAWVLDHSKRTPGLPRLHIYRNRAIRVAALEPKEKREVLCRHWDSLQEFFALWEKNCGTKFVECCHDYQDLEEFENLFRAHFRDFLAGQLEREAAAGRVLRKARCWKSNPFRGLNFFDFEHAAIYHGRTKAIGEVINALKNQAMIRKPFVLVLGASGSGKSSLIRAGVLPLLTRGGTPLGVGPWRRALARPGVGRTLGDPFDTLAAALLAKSALPELQDAVSPKGCWILASELKRDPESAANRITETLDQLSLQELDRLLDETDAESATIKEATEVARQNKLRWVKPQIQLALVVDQLEELFTEGFSPEIQRRYIAALSALVRCERILVIAALRSDFHAPYHQFPELVELTAPGGSYELQPPTPHEIRNMIRLPAEAAGLRFERHPETGQSLDEALIDAAVGNSESLPLLEQLLSLLYQRQLKRKGDLLRWSDYREFGELPAALANHAETVFLTLKSEEREALKFVMPHLVSFSPSEEDALIRRTVPYRDVVSSPELGRQQKAGAKDLVDRLIKEGLLSAVNDPQQGMLVGIAQDALLRRWPGVRQLLCEDRDFLRMRDRLDVSLTRWLSRGRQTGDLLGGEIELAEADALIDRFGSSLSEIQVDYIRKSLTKRKRLQRMRIYVRLALTAGLAVLGTIWVVKWSSAEIERKKGEQGAQRAPQNADVARNQKEELPEAQMPKPLEAQMPKPLEDIHQVQQVPDPATTERDAFEPRLEKAQEELARLAQQNADPAASHNSVSDPESQKEREDVQAAQEDVSLTTSKPKPGQIQPPNPGQKGMPSAPTQPLDPSVQSAHP